MCADIVVQTHERAKLQVERGEARTQSPDGADGLVGDVFAVGER